VSDVYNKLFKSIVASTIVSEPLATRWLWVTMLSQSDAAGCVWGSVPGLARLANITLHECETALKCFLAPDPYSRTKDHEGRRIENIDGGWRLLNHAKYAAIRNGAERVEYKRKWDRRNRPSGHARAQSDNSPTVRQQSDAVDPKSDSPTPPTPTPTPTPGKSESRAREFEKPTAPEPTPGGLAARALIQAGVVHVSPTDPRLLKLLEAGVTTDELRDAAAEAVAAKKGTLAYVCGVVRGRREDAANAAVAPPAKRQPVAAAHVPYVPEKRVRGDPAAIQRAGLIAMETIAKNLRISAPAGNELGVMAADETLGCDR